MEYLRRSDVMSLRPYKSWLAFPSMLTFSGVQKSDSDSDNQAHTRENHKIWGRFCQCHECKKKRVGEQCNSELLNKFVT